MKELRIFGPPGTGKTTHLATEMVPKAAQRFGSDKIMITSFTRAAAHEIASKKSLATGQTIPVDLRNVGTLHALVYRALSAPELAQKHLTQWNDLHPTMEFNLGQTKKDAEDDTVMVDSDSGGGDGDKLLNIMDKYRARMVPQEDWPPTIQDFASKWKTWKDECDYMDFTDLIEYAHHEMPYAPGNPSVIIVDEAQDFTQLQLSVLRGWAYHTEWLALVGDDDQCSRANTMVQTIDGKKPIQYLDPEKDRLLAYCRRNSLIYGKHTGGFGFKMASRLYTGVMHKITCGNHTTNATHNHHWLVKWSDKAKHPGTTAVYLMRKDDNFRIGWCQLFGADGDFYVGLMAKLEKADAAWILNIVESKTTASLLESYYSAQFGITTTPFKPHMGPVTGYYNNFVLDKLFQMLGDEQLGRACKLLSALNQSLALPFWKKTRAHWDGRSIMRLRSCHLFKGFMMLPVYEGANRPPWRQIEHIDKYRVKETVYSLDVDKHHTYIADGLITHNCLYRFAGATPDAFLNPPIDDTFKRVLSQSYRVPRAVHAFAQGIVDKIRVREPKQYMPRDFEGDVARLDEETYLTPKEILDHAQACIKEKKSVMILASCSYMLEKILFELRSRGVPFANKYRKKRGDWNPLKRGGEGSVSAVDLLSGFLSKGENDSPYWDIPTLLNWISYLKVGEEGLIRAQGNKAIKALKQAVEDEAPGLHSCENVLAKILSPAAVKPALDRDTRWLVENLKPQRQKSIQYPIKVAEAFGVEAVEREPLLTIGTIHSVKGAEADVVFLYPDISFKAKSQLVRNDEDFEDSLYRMFYVGATRAREQLIVMGAADQKGSCNFVDL